jgi:hypothetical protein
MVPHEEDVIIYGIIYIPHFILLYTVQDTKTYYSVLI